MLRKVADPKSNCEEVCSPNGSGAMRNDAKPRPKWATSVRRSKPIFEQGSEALITDNQQISAW